VGAVDHLGGERDGDVRPLAARMAWASAARARGLPRGADSCAGQGNFQPAFPENARRAPLRSPTGVATGPALWTSETPDRDRTLAPSHTTNNCTGESSWRIAWSPKRSANPRRDRACQSIEIARLEHVDCIVQVHSCGEKRVYRYACRPSLRLVRQQVRGANRGKSAPHGADLPTSERL
jgi:hypothetical protein